MKLALKVNDADNVATVFANDVTADEVVEVRDKKGGTEELRVLDPIPYGHKTAIRDITQGEIILKYGEEIGVATRDIKKGSHVHVQNLDSMRGRGDL